MQVFYRAHVIGAALFVVFGIVHWNGVYYTILAGLVVYGIDVAYRWVQTQQLVSVRVAASGAQRVLSVVVPLQVRPVLTTCICTS